MLLPPALLALLQTALVSLPLTAAEPIPLRDVRDAAAVAARALPNSPSGNYAPAQVSCPSSRPTIRAAGALSPDETAWLAVRRKATVQPMADFLGRAGISGFDAAAYVNAHASNLSALPNIGVAMSGGGYRALMNGAGFVAAADSRTPGSTDKGGIGGLLQSATYLAGLSGGGWLVTSIYANNFTTVTALRDGSAGSSVWRFDRNIIQGPQEDGISILNTAEYWVDINDQVQAKRSAGFEASITDFWGRALSYQMINDTDGGPAYTFSSYADADGFKTGQQPMPILVADGRAPGTTVVSLNATVFEFNPFEMGSFDPAVFGFAPTRYLGSNFSGGAVPEDGHCVEGFDQAGYVMGTSSSLFNTFLLGNLSSFGNVPTLVIDAVEAVLADLGNNDDDIAQYVPNPFFGYGGGASGATAAEELDLVDGGEDLQNLPLQPLLQPARAVDVIIAVDSSADTTYNWPNGTALRATWDRSQSAIANGTLFPAVPDADTFVNEGLNQRPVFFGCDSRNFTLGKSPGGNAQVVPPLVVYIPNAPYTAFSNVSTFTLSYPSQQKLDIIRNGYDGATQGNGSLDADWPSCLACAALSRSFERTGTAVPAACTVCFTRYCWNGTLATGSRGEYEPTLKIGNQTSAKSAGTRSSSSTSSRGLAVGLVLGVAAYLFL